MTFSQSEDICRAINNLTKEMRNITHELTTLNSKVDKLSVESKNSDINGIFTESYKPRNSAIKGAFLQDQGK